MFQILEKYQLFPKRLNHFLFLPTKYERSSCCTSSPTFGMAGLLNIRPCTANVGAFHCGSILHSPNEEWSCTPFPAYAFLVKVSVQMIYLPLSSWVVREFCRYMLFADIFSLWVACHFLTMSFRVQFLNFNEVQFINLYFSE